MAAGLLLIREAGGWSTDAEGGSKPLEAGSIVCGNEHIAKALREVIQRPIPSKYGNIVHPERCNVSGGATCIKQQPEARRMNSI